MGRQVIGKSRFPLWIFDDCHPDSQGLRKLAGQQTFLRREGDFYPGLRSTVPDSYREWVSQLLAPAIAQAPGARTTLLDCTFAIASDAVDRLAPLQMIPHFDSLEGNLYAAVHYLCDPPFCGTGFYRHRRTGLERIDAAHFPMWQQGLTADAREFGLPHKRYPGDWMEAFEMIAEAPLRFGRLIAYPANCLHSGLLDGSRLSAAPGMGRLTITSLMRLEL